MLFTVPIAEAQIPALLAALSRREGFFVLGDPAGKIGEDNRWLLFGAEPRETLSTKGTKCDWHRAGCSPDSFEDNPFDHFAIWMAGRHVKRPANRPRPFLSGWVGWLAHDLAWHLGPHLGEHLRSPHAVDDLHLPDLHMALYGVTWAWDRVEQSLSVFIDEDICPTPSHRLRHDLEDFAREAIRSDERPGPHHLDPAQAEPNLAERDYIATIERIREYIQAGDVYQVNFTHRFGCPFRGDPLGLWWDLVNRHPMPWSALMKTGGGWLVGNSPECMLKIEDRHILTRPIKGTAPRGDTPSMDGLLMLELSKSEKDHAEHLMIVDLERNDLGRIAEPGSVEVTQFAQVASHPTLHHMVSTVEAKRRPEISTAEALRAVLPGGSVTGAPKARAIEIIDELEPTRRGPFYGAVGWIDRSGDCALNLAIRTGWATRDRFELAVGGGIVADSDPRAERAEARLKASAFLGTP